MFIQRKNPRRRCLGFLFRFLVVYDDDRADTDQVIKLRCLVGRQVDTAVTATVPVDISTEAGSPAGVMKTVARPEEGHPVLDEAFVVRLAAFLAAAFQSDIAGFVVDVVDAGRRAVASCNTSGYTVTFEFFNSGLEVDHMLFGKVDIDVRISDFKCLGIFAVSLL